jgi:hypothetical protein
VEEMDVGMVRRRRTPEARRSNGAVGRHARGGEKMDGGTGTREGEEEDKDARGGGVFFFFKATADVFLQNGREIGILSS